MPLTFGQPPAAVPDTIGYWLLAARLYPQSAVGEADYPSGIPPFIDTDVSGFFTIPVTTLPVGTYQWRLKGPGYLASAGSLALTAAAINRADMGTQLAGDITGDNVDNISDFNALKNNFGQGGAPPIRPDADVRK